MSASSFAASPASLPVYFSSFIGREDEQATLLRALESGRLVTLTGPGGIGKTRLAAETARVWLDTHPADAFFVDLSSTGEEALAASIFRQLAPSAIAESEDALYSYLAQGTSLLILDNCEHIADAASRVARALLESCPDVLVLATSRTALGVEGETCIALGPIHGSQAAAELFVDRARSTNASLVLTGDDLVQVQAICAGLDRMPLGIELAAASLRAFSLRDVRERLDQSLDAFESPLRGTPERQRSLRGAIEWSYGLLNERDRLLFARLAVFSGGWRLDSAEEVCSGEGLDRRQVLPALRHLVDHGLVLLDSASGRYRLLEPIRQFADQLDAGEQWHARHADAFIELMQRLGATTRARPAEEGLARAREEAQNLAKVIEWSLTSGQITFAIRVLATGAPTWAWPAAPRLRELARRATEHPEARLFGETWALARLAEIRMGGAGDERSEAHEVESIREALEVLADGPHRSDATLTLGRRLAWLGLIDEATDLLSHVLATAESAEDVPLQIEAIFGLVQAAQHRLDWQEVQVLVDEAIRLARAVGDRYSEGFAYGLLGDALAQEGRAAEAETALRYAQNLVPRALGETEDPSYTAMLARAILLQGRFAEAAALFRATIVNGLAVSDAYHVTVSVGGVGIALGLSGSPGVGAQLLAASISEMQRVGTKMFPAEREQLAMGLGLVRAAATSEEFESAFSLGEQMPIAAAGELALSFTPEASPPPSSSKGPANLTAREVEVLRLLASGHTNREIAGQLVLSLRTVETHIFNIYSKSDTGGRAAATGWAIANGIYDPRT